MHRAKPLQVRVLWVLFDESEEPKREQAAGDCSIELGGGAGRVLRCWREAECGILPWPQRVQNSVGQDDSVAPERTRPL
jgi:hypothetical protein